MAHTPAHLQGQIAYKSKRTGLTHTYSACGISFASATYQVEPTQKHVATMVTCKSCRKTSLFTTLVAGGAA